MGRVISYGEKTGYNDGDYLLLDNGVEGTKRIRADRVGIQLDPTLLDPNKAAPANAVKPIDATPTQGSTNAVQSGGVYDALHNTDTTLSQSGQAADAKVVGDEIADLKEDISHNGLATSIDEWKNGYRMANTGSALIEPEVSTNWRYCKIGCKVGDVFYINVDTDSYTGYRAWAFTDENEKILKFADKAAEVHIKIIAPEGTAYLVLNDYALNQAWTKRSLKGIYSELAAQH